MTATLTGIIEGQAFPVDVLAITALDAMVYEQATGGRLESKVAELTESANADGVALRPSDLAVVKWLFLRQTVDANAALAEVAASVPLFPQTPAGEAGDLVAPEAT